MNIVIKGVKKSFNKVPILDINELTLKHSCINAIVGPNGVGKTTLIRIIGGLDKNYQGQVLFDDKYSLEDVRDKVTIVMQRPYIFRDTVFNNAAMGLRFRKAPQEEIEKRTNKALDMVGLKEYKDRLATTLSGGEAQRLSFARAIAFNPRVVLLDEPTSNVDVENKALIGRIITDMKTMGINVVLISHDSEEIKSLADNIIKLNKIQSK